MTADTMRSGPDVDIPPLTFGDEDRLPRVPLPSLAQSCERFLVWCAPLLTDAEMASTRAAVADFVRAESPAHLLHASLERYHASDGVHSWLDAFWDDRYLGRRDRIALNANFFCLLDDAPLGQVERAAQLIVAMIHYKLLLDAQRIPPAVRRGHLLSMEQNKYLFSTTRIPGVRRDTVRSPYSDGWPGPSRERHVVIQLRGSLFRMDAIDSNGRPYGIAEVAAGLRKVMAGCPVEPDAGAAIGHLTTKARAEWAKSREALVDHHQRNIEILDVIERALFCVCLDDGTPEDVAAACDQLLHGDSANRWFDKSLSLVVFGDGRAGFNVEHSRLGGTTVAQFIEILHDLTRVTGTGVLQCAVEDAIEGVVADQGTIGSSRSIEVPAYEPLAFVLSDELRADAAAAALDFARHAADTATATVVLREFGANLGKRLMVSPDAFLQLAFALAHRRARGLVGATYESVAMRHYHHGRTEAMRVVTPEIVRFVEAMDDHQVTDATRMTAVRAAATAHTERVRQCQAGDAPEQHLWELQLIQQRIGHLIGVTEPPAMYTTPGWLTMRTDFLSTSSTASSKIQYAGFGPTSDQCIGVSYMISAEETRLYLSAPRSLHADLHRFVDGLGEAVVELQALFTIAP